MHQRAALNAVDRLYRAYHRRDAREAAALYAPRGWHREVATGRVSRGRDEIRSGLDTFLTAFPNARWEIETRIEDDRTAAVTYRLTGALKAPLGPIEARGQRLDLRGVHIFTFDPDHLSWTEDYWDALTFHRQMNGT